MIVDLNLDVSMLNPGIFSKGNDPRNYSEAEVKLVSDYANAFSEWDKTKIGEAPKVPVVNFTPFQAALSLIKRAIMEAYKVGNTSRLRHLIRLTKDVDDQNVPDANQLILTQDDVAFIRKHFSKVEWKTENTPMDLIKFIVMVENSLNNAKISR